MRPYWKDRLGLMNEWELERCPWLGEANLWLKGSSRSTK
jgi:hypothetical protein